MTVNAQRAQLAEFTVPYYREGVNTLLLKDSQYKGALDLAAQGDKVNVSVLQNVFAEQLVHDAMPKAKVLQLDTQANVMLALDSGRVQAAAVDDSTVRWMVAPGTGQMTRWAIRAGGPRPMPPRSNRATRSG